jgi:hypothetical protein
MNTKSYAITLALSLALVACAEPQATEQVQTAPETAAEITPVPANENLMRLTCADFLSTAEVAMSQPADEAALAAQDEMVTGLTWLHGYLYAARAGKIDVLSQNWMKATAKQVHETCAKAGNPAETSLFEVATS